MNGADFLWIFVNCVNFWLNIQFVNAESGYTCYGKIEVKMGSNIDKI